MAANRSLICLAVLAAGCGDRAPEPPDASLVRDCRSHVDGRLAADAREQAVGAGPLWFPSARSFANAPHPNPGARFVDYKTLVVVEGGEEVTVAVPERERRRASLDYAYGVPRERPRAFPVKVSDGEPVVRFVACDDETQFNGGIVTSWDRCLPLDVWPGGADQPRRVELSFGAGNCRR